MTKPVRLKLSRQAGFNLQAHSLAMNGLSAVNVARPGKWGNPFAINSPSGFRFKDGGDPTPLIASLSREQAINFYRDAVTGYLCPEMHPWGHDWIARWRKRHTSPFDCLWMLRGKNLACFCKIGEGCHADVLLELANRPICEAA